MTQHKRTLARRTRLPSQKVFGKVKWASTSWNMSEKFREVPPAYFTLFHARCTSSRCAPNNATTTSTVLHTMAKTCLAGARETHLYLRRHPHPREAKLVCSSENSTAQWWYVLGFKARQASLPQPHHSRLSPHLRRCSRSTSSSPVVTQRLVPSSPPPSPPVSQSATWSPCEPQYF